MKILDPLPSDRVLSLLLTLQCTAECSYCGTNSSPRVKSKLAYEDALNIIEQASENNYKLVVFTGGEPLLYGNKLFDLIAYSKKLGLLTRVVTNAYWANSLNSARKIITHFFKNGLDEINFSTGDEHVKFVPLSNIFNATRASFDFDIPVSIMIEVVLNNKINKKSILTDNYFESLFCQNEIDLINFCESPWMPLDENIINEYPDGVTVNKFNILNRKGCDSIINTTTILSTGKIMACCGLGTQSIPELEIGHIDNTINLNELNKRLDDDFLKRWIKIEGPEKILAWASEKDPNIIWENMYAHRCQACKRIYSDEKVRNIIEKFHNEKILDVLTSEWLMFHYDQKVNIIE